MCPSSGTSQCQHSVALAVHAAHCPGSMSAHTGASFLLVCGPIAWSAHTHTATGTQTTRARLIMRTCTQPSCVCLCTCCCVLLQMAMLTVTVLGTPNLGNSFTKAAQRILGVMIGELVHAVAAAGSSGTEALQPDSQHPHPCCMPVRLSVVVMRGSGLSTASTACWCSSRRVCCVTL